MPTFTLLDLFAFFWFVLCWSAYAFTNDRSRVGRLGLSKSMDRHRRAWMREAARREVRIVDTQVMASLQNGTAFFASTSLIALGGSFTLLSQAERLVALFKGLPIHVTTEIGQIEIKVLGLCLIYGYAFFQFGWAYRLFNYASILLGAIPSVSRTPTPEELDNAERASARPAAMQIVAGRHFNWGLRALFFSMGYLGFLVNAWAFMATTTFITAVLVRRQYFSSALMATLVGLDEKEET